MDSIEQQAAHYAVDSISGLEIAVNVFANLTPDNPANVVVFINTGGAEPSRYLPNQSPSFQILVRNVDYNNGWSLVMQLRDLFHNQYNLNFQSDGNYIWRCNLLGEPAFIGQTEDERYEWSMNFILLSR